MIRESFHRRVSSPLTALPSSKGSCRRRQSMVNGPDSTTSFIVCGWPHTHLSDDAIWYLCANYTVSGKKGATLFFAI